MEATRAIAYERFSGRVKAHCSYLKGRPTAEAIAGLRRRPNVYTTLAEIDTFTDVVRHIAAAG